MIKKFAAWGVMFLFVGCTTVDNSSYLLYERFHEPPMLYGYAKEEPQEVEKELDACGEYKLSEVKTLSSDAELSCDKGMFGRADYPVERGEVNGVSYSIYHRDGSAGFYNEPHIIGGRDFGKNWSVSCNTDPLNDARQCTISRSGFMLFVYNGAYSLSTAATPYPGTTIAFRVDGNQAVTAREDSGITGPRARSFVNQMKAGNRVVTRYYDWPFHSSVVNEFSTNGFEEAYKYMLEIM